MASDRALYKVLTEIRDLIGGRRTSDKRLSWAGAPSQVWQLTGASVQNVQTRAKAWGGLRLGSLGRHHAETPSMVEIQISHDFGPDTTLPGNDPAGFGLTALVRWATGKGTSHHALIDVPAGGTAFSMAAADGLDVQLIAEGDDENAELANVTITANLVGQCHPRAAQRTLLHTLPADNGLILPIPIWSRSARLVTDVTAGVGTLVLRLFADALGATLVAETPFAFDRIYPIPRIAKFFSVFDSAGPPPSRLVSSIWELQL